LAQRGDDDLAGKITQAQFQNYAYQLGSPLTWTSGGQTYTFTLAYAQSINDALKSTATASQYAQLWRNAARDHYQNIIQSLP
jgi:hypothetical protein